MVPHCPRMHDTPFNTRLSCRLRLVTMNTLLLFSMGREEGGGGFLWWWVGEKGWPGSLRLRLVT